MLCILILVCNFYFANISHKCMDITFKSLQRQIFFISVRKLGRFFRFCVDFVFRDFLSLGNWCDRLEFLQLSDICHPTWETFASQHYGKPQWRTLSIPRTSRSNMVLRGLRERIPLCLENQKPLKWKLPSLPSPQLLGTKDSFAG